MSRWQALVSTASRPRSVPCALIHARCPRAALPVAAFTVRHLHDTLTVAAPSKKKRKQALGGNHKQAHAVRNREGPSGKVKQASPAQGRASSSNGKEASTRKSSALNSFSRRLGALFGMSSEPSTNSSPPDRERLAARRAARRPRPASELESIASATAAQKELEERIGELTEGDQESGQDERHNRETQSEKRYSKDARGVRLPQAEAWNSIRQALSSVDKELNHRQPQGSPTSVISSDEWGPDRLVPMSESGLKAAQPSAPDESERRSSFILPHQHPDLLARARVQHVSAEADRAKTSTTRWQARTLMLSGDKAKQARLISEEETGPFSREMLSSNEAQEDEKILQEVGSLSGADSNVQKIQPLREMKVPVLAHGLDRVLFNPGVYWLRDPRSGIYNFDPKLREILDVDLFDYSALSPYITSSKDQDLLQLTKENGSMFCGSTSSMTSMMSQCYFLLSGWKQPDLSGFSSAFRQLPTGFGAGARLPASITLNYNDGVYAIDADKEASGEAENSNYVLTSLGKSLEKMLTSTTEEYERYKRINSHTIGDEERNAKEAYHYAKSNLLMMRSQLDCSDERLPRRTFDLKTRAVVAVRQDRANWVESSGYQIRRSHGLLESFEREYFDMIRSAFLKYGLQARIGHMDGIMVAYHNTATMFGFQYIPLEEMNQRVYGGDDMAEQSFRLIVGLVERVLKAATELYPEQTLKMTFDTADHQTSVMSVYVEPAQTSSSAPVGLAASRDLIQLDVSLDRYLNDSLVSGPVDFNAVEGRQIDPTTDDELSRRAREASTPVTFSVRYRLAARMDLQPAQVRTNLAAVRKRQAALSALLLPNVDAINERERYRETELAKNPEALRQYLEDRETGVAKGMPMAPGQLAPGDGLSKSDKAKREASDAGEQSGSRGGDPEGSTKSAPKQPSKSNEPAAQDRLMRWRKVKEAQTMRMRELSRLGAADRAERERVDELKIYESRT